MISINFKGKLRPLTKPIADAQLQARNAAGETVVTKLQDHFLARNTQPNQKQWPKRGFWAGVLQAVGTNITNQSYNVVIASPAFWRRYRGGQPIAKKDKRLAIPAIAEAYAAGSPGAGRVPVALTTIVRKRAGKPPVVALAEYTERSTKEGARSAIEDIYGGDSSEAKPRRRSESRTVKVPGRIWYWLVQQANPLPGGDPNAIPPIPQLRDAATRAADAYLRSITRRMRTA